jgi:hypothetical protein
MLNILFSFGVLTMLVLPTTAKGTTFTYAESEWQLIITDIIKNGQSVTTITSSQLGSLGQLELIRGFAVDSTSNKVVGTGTSSTQLINDVPGDGLTFPVNELNRQTFSMTLTAQAEAYVPEDLSIAYLSGGYIINWKNDSEDLYALQFDYSLAIQSDRVAPDYVAGKEEANSRARASFSYASYSGLAGRNDTSKFLEGFGAIVGSEWCCTPASVQDQKAGNFSLLMRPNTSGTLQIGGEAMAQGYVRPFIPSPYPLPEPSTLTLLAVGLIGLGYLRRPTQYNV